MGDVNKVIGDCGNNMGPTTEIELGTTHTCVVKWNKGMNKADIRLKEIDDTFKFNRVSSSNAAISNMASSTPERIEGFEEHQFEVRENVIQEKTTEMSMAKHAEISAQRKMAMATPTNTLALVAVGSPSTGFSAWEKIKFIVEKIKATENEMKNATLEEASTSIRRRKGKSSIEGVAASSRVVKQMEVALLPKSGPKFVNENPYELYKYMGLFICKEHNGVKYLGSVFNYYLEMNLVKVQYKADGRIEYLTPMEALYNMAKLEDFSPSTSGSKEIGKNKKKRI